MQNDRICTKETHKVRLSRGAVAKAYQLHRECSPLQTVALRDITITDHFPGKVSMVLFHCLGRERIAQSIAESIAVIKIIT